MTADPSESPGIVNILEIDQLLSRLAASDADTDVRDLTSDQLQPGTLAELTSPSLFAERKVVVVRNAQDLSADTIKDVKAYLGAPAEEITFKVASLRSPSRSPGR